MHKTNYVRFTVVAAILCLLLPLAYGQAGKDGKKEFTFKGQVEKVDANAKSVTVKNESVPGWMNSMTMSYSVDKPDVLKTVKPGDQITAKVYEGDFKTLYGLQVVAPPAGSDKKAAPKK